jgi:hypothetical protein
MPGKSSASVFQNGPRWGALRLITTWMHGLSVHFLAKLSSGQALSSVRVLCRTTPLAPSLPDIPRTFNWIRCAGCIWKVRRGASALFIQDNLIDAGSGGMGLFCSTGERSL